mgnify:CR=1 FL=1
MAWNEPPFNRAPRHPLSAPVELPDGQGRCRNISNSGMYFEVDEPLAPGALVNVSLVLNNLPTMPPVQLEAEGRVVRLDRLQGKIGVAIEFASLRFDTADTRAARRPD